jgi:hypothetical protein
MKQYIRKRMVYYQKMKRLEAKLGYYGANQRKSFCGGRTNNLVFKADDSQGKIRYYDVTSMYPYILKSRQFPLQHPVVYNGGFDSPDFNLKDMFGFVLCSVLAPKDLYLPVLPSKINGRLEFVLCEKCAIDSHQGSCTHSDEERQLTGTWTTEELNMAIEKGYKVRF